MNAPAAPPFPLNPSVGQRWQGWMWNGGQWVWAPTTGISVNVQIFPASAPYMPSQGLISAVVEAWGAGAGGGGVQAGATMPTMGGGGGGSGGYSKKWLPASLVMGGVVVSVGAGGVGGTTQGVNGSPGGLTSFGAYCVANGGHGGVSAWSNATQASSGYGGAPAPVGTGDLAFAGNAGQTGGYALPGEEVEVVGGLGGAAPGSGGVDNVAATLGGTNVVADGPPGLSAGAGGGGAASANTAAVPPGGTGADGLCVVTEYCFNDASEAPPGGPFNVAARVEVNSGQWGNNCGPGSGGLWPMPVGGEGFDD